MSDSNQTLSSTSVDGDRPFRFRLITLLMAVTVFSVFLGSIRFYGAFGFCVFGVLVGIGVAFSGAWRRSRKRLIVGSVLALPFVLSVLLSLPFYLDLAVEPPEGEWSITEKTVQKEAHELGCLYILRKQCRLRDASPDAVRDHFHSWLLNHGWKKYDTHPPYAKILLGPEIWPSGSAKMRFYEMQFYRRAATQAAFEEAVVGLIIWQDGYYRPGDCHVILITSNPSWPRTLEAPSIAPPSGIPPE